MTANIFKNSGKLGAFGKLGGAKNVFKSAPSKKTQEDLAVPTGGSNLEKVLSFIDRPGAAVRQGMLNAINEKPILQGTGDILTGTTAEHPSGSDVLTALRGGKLPESMAGKAGLAVGGFGFDVLNYLDPLNWIGVGEVKNTVRGLQKAGELAKFTEGLIKGERAIVSARVPFTDLAIHSPQFMNKASGYFLKGLGDAAMAIPGAEKVAKVFKAPFDKLRTYSNKTIAKAAKMAQEETIKTQAKDWQAIRKTAVKSVNAGDFDRINPEMSAYYKQVGYSPEQIVDAETKRLMDAPIKEAGMSKDVPKSIQGFMNKIPTTGETLEPIKKMADLQGRSLYRLGLRANSLGIQGSLGEKFGAPRVISPETQTAIERVGKNAGSGSPGKASRVFTEFTSEQVEAARRNPKIMKMLFKEIPAPEVNPVIAALQKASPKASTFYEMNTGKAFEKYISSKSRQIATAEGVGDIMKNPSIASKVMTLDKPVKVDIPATFQKVMTDLKKSGAPVNIGHMYMHPDTAHEFRNFVGLMTDQDKMNKTWGMMQSMLMPLTNLFKRITLLGPIGTVPYNARNAMSNAIQSGMAGALSPGGIKTSLFMGNALLKAGENPAKFAELASKLGEYKGLDLGKELATMKEGNLFNEGFTHEFMNPEKGLSLPEKLMGIGVAGKFSEGLENVFRIQHYMTRRLQGWAPDAALADVRKYLYDYSGGLSPQLNNLKAVFPFLSWTRLNVPVMFEHMIQHPGRFAVPQRLKTNIENTMGTDVQGGKPDERALDEYIKGDWHIRWNYDKNTGKWSYFRLKNTIPMADLEDFTSIDRFVDLMMSSLTPFLKTPYENFSNQSTFFKTAGGEPAKIENYPGETSKFLGMDLSKKTINWLRDIRPLNILQQFSGENPSDIATSLAGLGTKSIDLSKATDYAKKAFQRKKAELLLSRKYQMKHGKSTGPIDKLLEELKNNAYVPGGQ